MNSHFEPHALNLNHAYYTHPYPMTNLADLGCSLYTLIPLALCQHQSTTAAAVN